MDTSSLSLMNLNSLIPTWPIILQRTSNQDSEADHCLRILTSSTSLLKEKEKENSAVGFLLPPKSSRPECF
ncbi:hypothetical protein VNO77_04228 [Canavalia gladiata]|uniref:Uncharacterized protein n=1 Tax=Canavalia gladiata TaxID=3824 RepID=A0AAN9MWU0_CANGL